jgi:hypothetical protein
MLKEQLSKVYQKRENENLHKVSNPMQNPLRMIEVNNMDSGRTDRCTKQRKANTRRNEGKQEKKKKKKKKKEKEEEEE